MKQMAMMKQIDICLQCWRNQSIASRLTGLFFVALAIWVLATFKQHGISNDEYVQHHYGQLLIQWYASGFNDDSAFHFKNLYLYGGLFDLIAAGIEPYSSLWVWDLRHLISAGFGMLGFYGAYLLAKLVGGPRLGLLTVLLLMLTVSWSGTMFTHTKDVPFATCMLWALYASVFVTRDLEKTAMRYIVLLGVAVGCALGLRIGGAFAVIYLVLMLGMAWLQQRASWGVVLATVLRLMPAALIALVIMALCWPWVMMAPKHILLAVKSFSHFAFNMQTILNGTVYNIGDIPRTYLLQYLVVKLPEVGLLGLVSGLLIVCARLAACLRVMGCKYALHQNRTAQVAMTAVLVSVLFPLAFVLYDKPALYNGVRHFTFILPPLTILLAWGLLATWQVLANRQYIRALWAGLALGLTAITMQDILLLHPYEYMRFNRLAGSPQHAQYRWEGDYWTSALREVSHYLTGMNLPKQDKPYLVSICAENEQGEAYVDGRFKITKDWDASDFFIAGTNMHCHQVMKGKVIGAVYRDGMLLAVVKDRRALQGKDRWGTPAKN